MRRLGTGAEESPWGLPFFIVTHRPQEEPPGGAFTFVSGVEAAVERALQAAAGKDVHVMGGAEIIRQALAAGIIDELTIIMAPVVMGAESDSSTGSRNRSISSTSVYDSRRTRPSSVPLATTMTTKLATMGHPSCISR